MFYNNELDSERLKTLKETIFCDPELCVERARLVTESYKESEALPVIIRRAKAFQKVLSEMTIFIRPEELIVGNISERPRGVPIYPEYGVSFIKEEIDKFNKRPFDKIITKKNVKEELREICKYWKGKTREDRVVNLASLVLPEEVKKAWSDKSFDLNEVIHAGSKRVDGTGHLIVDYEKVLNRGFKGIIEEINRALAKLDFSDGTEAIKKRIFLEAAKICCNSAVDFAKRYAKLAKEMAEKERKLARKKELEEIAKICEWAPENPARTFWEAVQTIWFIQVLLWIESNGHSNGFGRVDQYLYPYYKKDLEEGRLTKESVIKLIEYFFIKIAEVDKVRPWTETVYQGGRPTYQSICLGGQTCDANDATNDLSYLFLEASARLKLPEPIVIIRVHSKTPDRFLVEAVKALMRHGGGIPNFFSDEAVIPALMDAGIPLKEARNYAMMACSEPIIPGKSLSHGLGIMYVNLPKVLELSLNGGTNPNTGICLHPASRNLKTFRTFNEVVEAYKSQIKYYTLPFVSALIDYRIEIGKDVNEGGGPNAVLSNTLITVFGVPNVANSLAAIKKYVFEEKKISREKLDKAIVTNFEGPRSEEIRQVLLRAPKYGNDDDYVDLIAAEVANNFVSELKKYNPSPAGGVYGPSFQTITGNVPAGKEVGATPDGRKSGEPLADNISPQAGTDVKGVTAMLKSVSKIDHSSCFNGSILNVKFHPTALKGDGVRKLAWLIKTYLSDLKGWQVQFNIVSADKLRDAQKYPEENRDLIVKVAGYSAQYISLDKELQDQIIERTENIV